MLKITKTILNCKIVLLQPVRIVETFEKNLALMDTEKQRVLILNKCHLFEIEEKGKWVTKKVMLAPPNMKAGIHLLHNAKPAEYAKNYEGQVIHKDGSQVFQKVSQGIVKHQIGKLEMVPDIGDFVRIRCGQESSKIEKLDTSITKSRGR